MNRGIFCLALSIYWQFEGSWIRLFGIYPSKSLFLHPSNYYFRHREKVSMKFFINFHYSTKNKHKVKTQNDNVMVFWFRIPEIIQYSYQKIILYIFQLFSFYRTFIYKFNLDLNVIVKIVLHNFASIKYFYLCYFPYIRLWNV